MSIQIIQYTHRLFEANKALLSVLFDDGIAEHEAEDYSGWAQEVVSGRGLPVDFETINAVFRLSFLIRAEVFGVLKDQSHYNNAEITDKQLRSWRNELYAEFLGETNLFEMAVETIKRSAENSGREADIRPYSPLMNL